MPLLATLVAPVDGCSVLQVKSLGPHRELKKVQKEGEKTAGGDLQASISGAEAGISEPGNKIEAAEERKIVLEEELQNCSRRQSRGRSSHVGGDSSQRGRGSCFRS